MKQAKKKSFDKHANRQHDDTQTCPLCKQVSDTTEHLSHCTEAGAHLIRQKGQTAVDQRPTEGQLADNTDVSTQQAAQIRSALLDIVKHDFLSQTGLFSSPQTQSFSQIHKSLNPTT